VLHNYLAAACRHLLRGKLYSAINIVGLAVGFTAGLLIALFVHDEESYDRFWPHYDETYMVSTTVAITGEAPFTMDAVPAQVIAPLRSRLPAGVIVARAMAGSHAVRRGKIEANEDINWVDPSFFSVLRPLLIAGDLDSALKRPDALVLTQHIARKYFGDASPVGQLLEVDRNHPLRITAVIRDIPSNSFLHGEIFGSGLASFAGLGALDAELSGTDSKRYGSLGGGMAAYLRLPREVPPARIEAALQAAVDQFRQVANYKDVRLFPKLLPVASIHLSPPSTLGGVSSRGNPELLRTLALIGVVIVAMAGINFVNLMTARAGRRAVEIGVRKALGATPRDLIVQFIGESLLYSLAAMLIAVSLVELLLPAFNDFLQRDISLSYGGDLGFALLVALVAGAGAGFYPALVLSRFRPAWVLRGKAVQSGSGGPVRQVLVVFQFAVLVCLLLATLVVYRQVQFALHEGLRFDKDQVLAIWTSCKGSFPAEVRKLPGVRSAACSGSMPLEGPVVTSGAEAADGTQAVVCSEAIEPGLLELYGLHPVAGRFFSASRPGERLSRGGEGVFIGPVVLNETAVRKMRFRSPQDAIGQTLRHPPGSHTTRTDVSEIIGIAPDVPSASVRDPVLATVFHTDVDRLLLLSVKLAGAQVPETLSAIDELWKRTGEPRPIERVFVDQAVQERYLGELRQGKMFAAFACIGLFIACLGLFGLAAFTAERRTKEIGVRKAMGATRGEIIGMLLWQFTRPVLIANLIAWPVGFYLMSRWLQGYAYHIELSPWIFLAAGALAVAIAWLTVSSHALLVARARPATALRHD
jgi:putative ABC transport system permease protein